MTIHIFNPEHDYALASFSPYYTPPAEVMRLRSSKALTPLRYASHGDAILALDEIPADNPRVSEGIQLLTTDRLPEFLEAHPEARIQPWGWNPMLRHILLQSGADSRMLPSDEWLAMLRLLSHRSTTIDFNRILNQLLYAEPTLRRHVSPLPLQFSSAAKALLWEKEHHPAFFKAPWSSSGRGILFTDGLDPQRHILPWLNGIIRRQGSVMAEAYHPKAIDFATEWQISQADDGRPIVSYLGVSVFEASRRGKYHSNLNATQEKLRQRIRSVAPDFSSAFIEAQREAISRLLLSRAYTTADGHPTVYTGYLGIDMLASSDGLIRGCIELNFRRTMGIPPAPLCIIGTGNVGTHMHRAFTRAGIRTLLCSGRSTTFPPAETYIICVKDTYVAEVASRITPPEGAIIAHTSGATPLSAIMESRRAATIPGADSSSAGTGSQAQPDAITPSDVSYGVFYPLQTFSRDVEMDYRTIPLLIEGSDTLTTRRLMKLASEISGTVVEADSGRRGLYHVAAVMTCNFFNHLCTLADDFLHLHNLDIKILLPLLRQTVDKLSLSSPASAQTGPAVRGDEAVISSHLQQLNDLPATAAIYRILSDSITAYHNTAATGDSPAPPTDNNDKSTRHE